MPHEPHLPSQSAPPEPLAEAAGEAATDAEGLARFGYAQELLRGMGGFSTFALSFSIISVLTGAVTLYGHGLRFGGPFVMSVGWPLVTLATLPVAASLAQLASSFPTAGALYHWSALLGGPGWGFLTAWLNTIGQFAITAGIDYGLAELLAPMLGLPADRAHLLALYAALLASHAALNHVGVRAVARLNDFSALYHIAGVALFVGLLAFLAPHPHPLAFLATRATVAPEGYAYGFLVGLLQAAWTFTGFDASAHVTEETVDPTRKAPWGIFLSVVVSGFAGFALVLAVTMAAGDLGAAMRAESPLPFILRGALGDRLGAALVWLALGAMWFCGLASVTSNSRMLFAFARDGGLPFSARLARVSPRYRSPHVAVWTSAAAAFAIAVWAEAYSAVVALSTIALYASYAVPIAIGQRARRRGLWRRRGPWDLGRFSTVTNVAALAWTAIATVLFVLPPNELAGETFAGCLLLLAIYWFAFMRRRFVGPRVSLAALEAQAVGDPTKLNDRSIFPIRR